MKRSVILLAVLLCEPALAAPGGPIDTLPLGGYACELPGDAAGPVGHRVPEQDFTILNASSYRTPAGSGIYLLTGDVMTMTSGPKAGQRFHRITDNFVRLIQADGSDSQLRCVRGVINNS
jgi:hypothetical protein